MKAEMIRVDVYNPCIYLRVTYCHFMSWLLLVLRQRLFFCLIMQCLTFFFSPEIHALTVSEKYQNAKSFVLRGDVVFSAGGSGTFSLLIDHEKNTMYLDSRYETPSISGRDIYFGYIECPNIYREVSVKNAAYQTQFMNESWMGCTKSNLTQRPNDTLNKVLSIVMLNVLAPSLYTNRTNRAYLFGSPDIQCSDVNESQPRVFLVSVREGGGVTDISLEYDSRTCVLKKLVIVKGKDKTIAAFAETIWNINEMSQFEMNFLTYIKIRSFIVYSYLFNIFGFYAGNPVFYFILVMWLFVADIIWRKNKRKKGHIVPLHDVIGILFSLSALFNIIHGLYAPAAISVALVMYIFNHSEIQIMIKRKDSEQSMGKSLALYGLKNFFYTVILMGIIFFLYPKPLT